MMFDPVLRDQGTDRVIYTTPLSLRILSAAVGLLVVLSAAMAGHGPFLGRFGVVAFALLGLCLVGILYVERWTFDRAENFFQRELGILLLHSRAKRPLDSLAKVVLRESASVPAPSLERSALGTRSLGSRSRGTGVLSLVDRDGRGYRLNIVRGGDLRVLQLSAEKLAAFCSLPLERQRIGNG